MDSPHLGAKPDASPAPPRRTCYVNAAFVPLKVKHVTEYRRGAEGPDQLGAYAHIPIDVHCIADPGSVVGSYTRIFGRRVGGCGAVHRRERDGDHWRLPPALGTQELRGALGSATLIYGVREGGAAEQRVLLGEQSPHAPTARRRQRPCSVLREARLLVRTHRLD